MNAVDILRYGHQTVLGTIEGIGEREWDIEGACAVWSIKDLIAHLASYEYLLVEVLSTFLDGGPTPYMEQYGTLGVEGFNTTQVERRRGMSAQEAVADYTKAHEQTMALIERIPEETRRKNGTLPWYGAEYALDDFIVYAYYGHKREHCGQIAVFRDRFKAPAAVS